MRLIRNLMLVGAGLVLTACGSGGGDGDSLGGSSYEDEIVVRVVLEDGSAFRNVAVVNNDYSLLMVTFDVDDSGTINEDDLRLTYGKIYSSVTGYDEYYELLRRDGIGFLPITDITQANFVGDTMEWVIDTPALEDEMDMLSVITDETGLRVEAIKDGASFLESEDLIPDSGTFTLIDAISGRVDDDADDFDPSSGGTSAVDLRSVRVFFF